MLNTTEQSLNQNQVLTMVMPIPMERSCPLALINLLRLVSPMLPIGSFTWSQGLETAVERTWIYDRATAFDWIHSILLRSLAAAEGPLIVRLYEAFQNDEHLAFAKWNELLLAMRETSEFRKEDLEQGELLLKIVAIHEPQFEPWPLPYTFAAAFVVAAGLHGIDREHCLLGFLWLWVESQATTVTKLVPLGLKDSQLLIKDLIAEINQAYVYSQQCPESELGYSTLGRSLASAWHEQQYCRIFRS